MLVSFSVIPGLIGDPASLFVFVLWKRKTLDRDPTLRATVLARLQQGWSPQQVAGRLAVEQQRTVISHETIYRFIYAQMARKTEYAWRHSRPQAKAQRGRRARPRPQSGAPPAIGRLI